ncbi:MAG TPA: NAD(P)H-binding protein [Panacibacter sp.]|nr:NAD(P)H-binding protein [Panacibacter sp.]HNP45014.1 NAD(P)H-binding protein [Panacibacter sp.]
MNYTITGSLGNISKPIAEALVKAGHQVTVITSKRENAAAIEAIGAKAAVGSVEDVAFLTNAFAGADAVYTMVPPKWDSSEWKKWIGSIGENYAVAIEANGIQYVVNLSSIGADKADGVGPVSGLHLAEKALNKLSSVNVLHLRPGYFYQNQLANIAMINHMGINGGNFGDSNIVLVHPADIAEVAVDALLGLSFSGHNVKYIAGDEKNGAEISAALGTAIGKPQLPWIVFSDDQNLQGAILAGLPEEVAKNYTEMGAAMRTGYMFEDYYKNRPALSKIKLADFASEFAEVFNATAVANH